MERRSEVSRMSPAALGVTRSRWASMGFDTLWRFELRRCSCSPLPRYSGRRGCRRAAGGCSTACGRGVGDVPGSRALRFGRVRPETSGRPSSPPPHHFCHPGVARAGSTLALAACRLPHGESCDEKLCIGPWHPGPSQPHSAVSTAGEGIDWTAIAAFAGCIGTPGGAPKDGILFMTCSGARLASVGPEQDRSSGRHPANAAGGYI